MWRIVTEKLATLREVEESWSLTDLCDGHTILDMREDVERLTYLRGSKP